MEGGLRATRGTRCPVLLLQFVRQRQPAGMPLMYGSGHAVKAAEVAPGLAVIEDVLEQAIGDQDLSAEFQADSLESGLRKETARYGDCRASHARRSRQDLLG